MSAIEFNRSITGMYGSLKPYAVKLTRSLEDANDLLQETILKALTNRDKYRHNTNLKAWLYTIMRNIFINNYRKKVRQNTIFDNTDQSYLMNTAKTVNNDAPSNFVVEDIDRALEDLPDRYRTPFWMMYQGFKYHEIADALDVPLGTVKSRIFLARKQLSDTLETYGGQGQEQQVTQ